MTPAQPLSQSETAPPELGAASAVPVDPRPLLLWQAIAALPELVLDCYRLAYDMQHRALDELVDEGDTLELVLEQTEQEIGVVARLTERLIPTATRAARMA